MKAEINRLECKRLIAETTFLQGVPHGWGNGYVAVPPEHPLWGITYMDDRFPSLNVHGGVTFTEPVLLGKRTSTSKREVKDDYVGKRQPLLQSAELLDGEVPGAWWLIGFDTVHVDDNENNWPKERVIDETNELKNQLNKMLKMKKEFRNLTPHKIVLNSGVEYAPTGVVARVSNTFTEADANGICSVDYGTVEGLPDPQPNVCYIVSAMVLAAAKAFGRYDCVAPATGHPDCVRNDKGQIVSVPCFVK